MAAQNLVPVFAGSINDESVLLCDARVLHGFLRVGRRFSTWIVERIAEYGFVENQDFVITSPNREVKQRGGALRKDYHLTLDTAKELAMVERNEQGRAVRRYFIECEKQLRADVQLQPKQLAASVPMLPRVAGGALMFQGVPVMGMAQISEFFGCDRGVIKSNVEHFPERFMVGVHFFKISGEMLHQFALDNLHTGHIGRRHGKEWLIWSYEGVREHALCLPGRYSEAWQARWDHYATGEPAQEAVPVLEVVRPVNDAAFQSAINGLDVSMIFLQDSVKVAASVIERLVISTDPDAAGLCRMLHERCDEMHNLLDCIREDAQNLRAA